MLCIRTALACALLSAWRRPLTPVVDAQMELERALNRDVNTHNLMHQLDLRLRKEVGALLQQQPARARELGRVKKAFLEQVRASCPPPLPGEAEDAQVQRLALMFRAHASGTPPPAI